jgi:hypothetical protein
VLDHGQVLWADDYGVLHVFGVHARRARTYEIPGHPVSAVYPLGRHLLLATDAIRGIDGVQVRVTARPGAARARHKP